MGKPGGADILVCFESVSGEHSCPPRTDSSLRNGRQECLPPPIFPVALNRYAKGDTMRKALLLLCLVGALALLQPIARAVGTSYWRQSNEADFKAGTLENV